MTIPFLDIFKRAKARFQQNSEPAPVIPPRLMPLDKPTSERLSKTVMPNTVRTTPTTDPFVAAATVPPITAPFVRPSNIPPTIALALQPKVERAISLQLRDFLDRLPAGFIKPVESFDPAQRILLKASEVEKGMANGEPTVSLATIYEQVPEIFLRNVKPDDVTQVGLPFEKVLDQFNKVQVREDQEHEQEVPQVDTPILQVTMEDTKKFGTSLQTVQTSVHPPVKVEPATARAHSSAEPEPAVRETVGASNLPKGIPLNFSTSPVTAPVTAPRPSAPAPASPTRIPFKLPPNGTGGSDSERVPASSGPPVPTSAPPGGPARIPFKVSAPCHDLKPKLTLIPGTSQPKPDKAKDEAVPTTADTAKISLGLRAVLQNMPGFQLTGSPETVGEDQRVELSLSLVESQLASGRIAIPLQTFRQALPENYRELVATSDAESPVLLPLQEVLRSLPSTVLKMRPDQEQVETGEIFETPFSIKAKEDAERFKQAHPDSDKKAEVAVPPATEAKSPAPVAQPKAELKMEPKAEVKPEPKIAPKVEVKTEPKIAPKVETKTPVAIPAAKEIKDESKASGELNGNTSAKEIIARASALPGVAACSITFEDGLNLAGNLPDDVQVGGLCAMAPSVLQKINRHTVDTKLGPLLSMTLHCRESQLSFYMQGNVCLTVLHREADLTTDTHHKLAEMAKELSRTYSQPETVHVDH